MTTITVTSNSVLFDIIPPLLSSTKNKIENTVHVYRSYIYMVHHCDMLYYIVNQGEL